MVSPISSEEGTQQIAAILNQSELLFSSWWWEGTERCRKMVEALGLSARSWAATWHNEWQKNNVPTFDWEFSFMSFFHVMSESWCQSELLYKTLTVNIFAFLWLLTCCSGAALNEMPWSEAQQCTCWQGFDSALFKTVENNCGYHLFESESEEEEEEVPEMKEEEEPPKKKSAFQVTARVTPETNPTANKWQRLHLVFINCIIVVFLERKKN